MNLKRELFGPEFAQVRRLVLFFSQKVSFFCFFVCLLFFFLLLFLCVCVFFLCVFFVLFFVGGFFFVFFFFFIHIKMHFYLLITTSYALTFSLSVEFVRHAFHLLFLLIFYNDV